MECSKIKTLLSEYVDGVLDQQTKAQIDEHLLDCQNCMTELNSLRNMVEALGSLQSLETPDDFLEKLHERIAAEGKLRKILRTLFVPGRIKIPLQFATAAAMAVLIFSILNIQHTEKKLSDAPERSADTKVARKMSIDTARHSQKKDFQGAKPVLGETTIAKPVKERETIELALLLKAEEPSEAYAPRAAMEGEPIPEGRVASRRAARLTAPSPEKKKEARRKEKQDIGLATEEKTAAESRRGNLGVYSDKVVSRVKEIIRGTKGRIISIEYDKQSGHPEIIQLEIPAQQYKLFSAELAKISVLQESPPPVSEKDKDWVDIRLRFITTE